MQRYMFARYHVTDPKTFYEGTNQWKVPEDPENKAQQAAAVPALGDSTPDRRATTRCSR